MPLQLPNTTREAMLRRGYAKALVITESLYATGFEPEQWYSFKEIYEVLSEQIGTSYKLVYHALQQKLVFQRRLAKAEPGQPGRRPYLYRVPNPLELVAEFSPEGNTTLSDTLKKRDLKTVTAYRRALYHNLFIRLFCASGKGFTAYRGFLADLYGVSERTLRSYDKQLGHSHDANYKEQPVGWHNWEQLPRFKANYDQQGRRLPSRQWLKIIDRRTGRTETSPLVKFLAFEALRADKAVYIVERGANTYYPYPKPETEGMNSIDRHIAHFWAAKRIGLERDREGHWYYPRE